ncbi:MAG: tetratricopeptide repeat protein [Clostridia bacterium]|nr:tetratricopeptide repeat protein [Clostridia bacterium]
MGLIGNICGFAGYYNHSRGKYDKALKWYEKAEQMDVSNPNFQMAYGVLLMREGNFEKAINIFNKILIFFPRKEKVKINAKINLSMAYWKTGDMDAAIDRITEMHEKLKNTRTYETLGYFLVEKGDNEEALKFKLEALDYDDTDAVILDNLGQTYYRMGDTDNALTYFKKALEEKDDLLDALYHVGVIHQERRQTEEAREYYEKALDCNITKLSTISRETIEAKLAELS